MPGGINFKHQPALTGRALGYRAVQVLGYVRERIESHGRAPSYGQICNELGISTKGEVSEIIARLEKRGLLMRAGSQCVRRGASWNQPVLRLPCM